MSTKMQVEWCRTKVLELLSKGNSQSEIEVLQVDLSIISRDVDHLRQEAKYNIKRYIDERLSEEYEKCRIGLNAITKEAWSTSQITEDKKEKIQALSLAKDCYSMKPDLLTNATVVDDAVRFVSSKSKEKIRSSSHGSSDEEEVEELQEPNYEEPGEINHISITTNDVF